MNRARFQQMKRTAFFINIGRGLTTRLDDLAAAIEAGEIAGAGLDVFEQEPLPADHKLWTLPGVLLTPHTAGYGPYLDERRYEVILDNCRRFLAGQPLAQPGRQGALVLSEIGSSRDSGVDQGRGASAWSLRSISHSATSFPSSAGKHSSITRELRMRSTRK